MIFHASLCFHAGCVVPGAGAFEVAVHNSLLSPTFLKTVSGRARLGVQVMQLHVCRLICLWSKVDCILP